VPRYKITIEYDGAYYVGWQRQPRGLSVQQAIEDALTALHLHPVEIVGAGRTDSGVHACGQVAHFDVERKWSCFHLTQALNSFLRDQRIAIIKTEEVSPDFHARFSAIARRYEYHIISRRAPLVLELGRAWQVYKPLDLEAMQKGAAHFLGFHDFSAFRDSQCQSQSAEKTMEIADLQEIRGRYIFTFKARSFLHHQVRNMVGTLKLIGEGRFVPDDIPRMLESKDRKQAGPTAPPDGLYFMEVIYPT